MRISLQEDYSTKYILKKNSFLTYRIKIVNQSIHQKKAHI